MPLEEHPRSARVPCLVPFCRRTMASARLAPQGDDEWICGPHWRAVPQRARTIYRRARAAERRAEAADAASYARLVAVPDHWRLPETAPVLVDRLRAAWRSVLAGRRARRLWKACRRRAIEAGGGIG